MNEGETAAPLILTLAMDRASFERFDRLRREHFPPGRNLVPAHVTLFHALPGERSAEVEAAVARACRRPPFDLTVTGVQFLGRGVAYALRSAELGEVRAGLAHTFAPWLTPQDRQGFRPHVTVQNKAEPARARELHARLAAGFAPFEVEGVGLALWRYLGGPWAEVGTYPFA